MAENAIPRQVAVLDRKRLNEMNRLEDMGRFPIPVLAGATFNVLLTMGVVWHFEPRGYGYMFPLEQWLAGILILNLLPVVLLRRTLGPSTVYPVIEEMNFFRDQHKFSNWVYVAASANMAFWVALTWILSNLGHIHTVILPLLVFAFLATFFPAWVRLFRR